MFVSPSRAFLFNLWDHFESTGHKLVVTCIYIASLRQLFHGSDMKTPGYFFIKHFSGLEC